MYLTFGTHNCIIIMELKSEVIIVSPRTGRPVIGEPKTNDIKVRLDNTTHEALLQYSKENNITKAEAIRRAIKLLLHLK